MTGPSGWWIPDQGLLLAFNIAAGGLWIGVAGLAAARMLRKRPPELRRSLLLGTLILLGLSPGITFLVQSTGIGLIGIEGMEADPAPRASSTSGTRQAFLEDLPPVDGAPGAATTLSAQASGGDRAVLEAAPADKAGPLRIVGTILLGVWAAGSLAVFLKAARGAFRLRRFLGTLSPDISPRLKEVAARAARALDLRRSPEVFVSASAAVPVLLAIPRPRIVVPSGIEDDLGDDELEAVLLHEMSHAGRGASSLALLKGWTAVLLWWCPPVAMVRRELDDLEEDVADGDAFRAQGDGLPLARALAGMAARARRIAAPRLAGASGMLKPSRGGLEARVARLLHGKMPAPVKGSIEVLAALSLALITVTGVLASTVRWTEASPAGAGEGKTEKAMPKAKSAAKISPEEKKLIEKLRSGKAEEVREAIEKLDERKSIAAIGPVLDLYVKSRAPRKDAGKDEKAVRNIGEARNLALWTSRAILSILRSRGKEAMPELEKAIAGSPPGARKVACDLLAGAERTEGIVEVLRKLEKDEAEEVRKAARKARERLEASGAAEAKDRKGESSGKAPKANAKGAAPAGGEERKLIEELRPENGEGIRETVARLVEMESIAAVRPLFDLHSKYGRNPDAPDELWFLSGDALAAILEKRGKEALRELEPAIAGATLQGKLLACDFLGGRCAGVEGAEEVLRRLKEDEAEEIRKAARRALDRFEASRKELLVRRRNPLGGSKMTLDVRDRSLAEVAEFFARVCGKEVAIDPSIDAEEIRVTAREMDVPADRLLAQILEKVGLRHEPDGKEGIRILPGR
jgi:hypothetical protein